MYALINILKCAFWVLFISVNLKSSQANPVVRPFRNTDICGRYNNHRVYLEYNEKGILKAENATLYKTVSVPISVKKSKNILKRN